MGNASNYILVILSINLIMGMIALGIASADPGSDLLLYNKLFGTDGNPEDNQVVSSINYNGSVASYDWNKTMYDTLGSGDNAFVAGTSSIFPDWIKAGWSYAMNAGRNFINFVGAPYTILSSMKLDPDLAAVIGSFFGIFSSFIMLNWLLGRDN